MRLFNISIILLFFLFNFSYVNAQETLELFIKDNFGKPIPYASVIWGKNIGLVSDTAGYLLIPDKTKIDSLNVSAVGFSNKIIKKDSIISILKIDIILEQNIIELPEIIVAKYAVEKDFGCIDVKRQSSYFKNTICSNLQGALLVNSYNYPAQCKSISIFVAKQSSIDIPYRLRLYEIGNDNLPGKELLSKNFIVYAYNTNSWNTYNFDSIAVQLPKNGFFAAIEWLCTDIKSDNGLCIGLTSKIDKPLTFYKYGNVGWQQLIYKTGISKDNIMIKAKIVSIK